MIGLFFRSHFLPTPLMTPSLMIQWKLDCRSRKQKRKNQPITMLGIEHCDWFILPPLLPTPTMQFSLDHKRRSHKRNRCSASGSDSLIFTRSYLPALLITTPTPTLLKTSVTRTLPRNMIYRYCNNFAITLIRWAWKVCMHIPGIQLV